MKPAEAPLRVGVAGRGSDADPDLVELGRKLGRALADRGASTARLIAVTVAISRTEPPMIMENLFM